MKIAVYHNLPSGGAKRALQEMLRGLCGRHAIDVFTLSSAEHDFCDLRPYANAHVVFPFKTMNMLRSPFGRANPILRTIDLLRARALQQQIAKQIDAGSYDLVFAQNCMIGQSPALLPFLRTPAVHFSNEPPRLLYEPRIPRPYRRITAPRRMVDALDPLPAIYARTYKALDRQNIASATRVLTNSAFTRENIYRIYGISAQVVYLGVNSEQFRPLGLPRQDYVLTVGATHPGKGFDFLIQSLALLPQAERPALVIVTNYAEPDEYNYLTSLAGRLGVKVEFRVMVSERELVEAYNQALVTVYAPIMEPFGFTPLESMACGTAVVGVAEGGVRESIQHGVTGLLTDRNPRQFAAAVGQLLSDAPMREGLAQNGRRSIEVKWNWQATIDSLENHFLEVVEAS